MAARPRRTGATRISFGSGTRRSASGPSRIGLAPIDYLQNLRIEEARRLLESSERSVDDIGAEIGYEEASFFRRLFKRRTGMAPAQYRRVFQPIHRA